MNGICHRRLWPTKHRCHHGVRGQVYDMYDVASLVTFISISTFTRAAACAMQTGRLWHQFRVVLVVGQCTFVSTKSDYIGSISGSQGRWAITPRSPGTHATSRAAGESRMFFLFGTVICFIRRSSHRLRENSWSELKCMCYTYPCHLQHLHSSPRCL